MRIFFITLNMKLLVTVVGMHWGKLQVLQVATVCANTLLLRRWVKSRLSGLWDLKVLVTATDLLITNVPQHMSREYFVFKCVSTHVITGHKVWSCSTLFRHLISIYCCFFPKLLTSQYFSLFFAFVIHCKTCIIDTFNPNIYLPNSLVICCSFNKWRCANFLYEI
jgi:hypothetical protein